MAIVLSFDGSLDPYQVQHKIEAAGAGRLDPGHGMDCHTVSHAHLETSIALNALCGKAEDLFQGAKSLHSAESSLPYDVGGQGGGHPSQCRCSPVGPSPAVPSLFVVD